MSKSFSTIKEFYESVQSGEIDETKLLIILDNDETSFFINTGDEEDPKEIKVSEANGYYDIEKLYPLLFPKATVEWC